MVDREYYCFMHNIKFENDLLFRDHQEECESLLGQLYVCKQHAVDGKMCGISFKNFPVLYAHCVEEHKVFICEICDAQSMKEEVMSMHSHDAKNLPSIHASK